MDSALRLLCIHRGVGCRRQTGIGGKASLPGAQPGDQRRGLLVPAGLGKAPLRGARWLRKPCNSRFRRCIFLASLHDAQPGIRRGGFWFPRVVVVVGNRRCWDDLSAGLPKAGVLPARSPLPLDGQEQQRVCRARQRYATVTAWKQASFRLECGEKGAKAKRMCAGMRHAATMYCKR